MGANGTLETVPSLMVMLAYALALTGVTASVFQRLGIEGARAT